MMHIKKQITIRISLLLLAGTALLSCDRQHKGRGHDFIPDMVYSRADTASRIKAGIELKNPFTATDEALVRGKLMFTTFCIHCHGKGGAGDGYLFTSGLYPLQPKNLSGEAGRKLKDGEIFHTITLGIRSMGAHGSQIKPDDRWKLVLYVRKLQEDALRRQDSTLSITK